MTGIMNLVKGRLAVESRLAEGTRPGSTTVSGRIYNNKAILKYKTSKVLPQLSF